MPRSTQSVHSWAPQLWAELLKQARQRGNLFLNFCIESANFRLEFVGNLDYPVHERIMISGTYVCNNIFMAGAN